MAPASAQDATWNLNPATNSFNNAANWTPTIVPTGTATFGSTSTSSITFNAATTLGGITLGAGTPTYTFLNGVAPVSFNGAGIVTNGGSVTFNTGNMTFGNASTAGNAIINNDQTVNFVDSSSAGSAKITNVVGSLIRLTFFNSSTAANAQIESITGVVVFHDNSSAGSALIDTSEGIAFNDNSSAGTANIIVGGALFGHFVGNSSAASANIFVGGSSVLFFSDNSTAGNAVINTGDSGIFFQGNSTAGNATINSGGRDSFDPSRFNNGFVLFQDNSTAANSTIISTGMNLQSNQFSLVSFSGNSSGGNARIVLVGPQSYLDIGLLSSSGTTLGSIEGDGTFILGSKQLIVGSNNLSTEVSGSIVDRLPNQPISNISFAVGGSLVKVGTGTLILSGLNTYTGGTTITSGTLQLGNGGAGGSIVGNVLNNATFIVNRSDSYTFDGVISGTGAFQQNGSGNTVLTASSTYTGATTVNAGTLSVNGSIASSSSLTVNSGATVGGTGTLPTTRINAGSTLSPGNSIGTITVSGNLTFVGAGNYLVEVSPTAADRSNVTGTANLAGSLRVAALGGTYIIGTRYVLLNAASVSGTFGSVAFTGTFGFNVRPDVTYDASNVILTLDPITTPAPPGTAPIPVPQLLPLLPAGTPLNPRNVAAALDPAFAAAGTAPGAFLALFNVSSAGLPGALSQLSGEVGTSAAVAGFQDVGQFLELMLDPFLENRVSGNAAPFGGPALAFAPGEGNAGLHDAASAYARLPVKAPPLAPTTFDQRWTVWGAAYGASGSFNGNAALGSHDLTARSGGFAGGIDYRVGPNTVIGFAASGSSLSYSLSGGLGSGSGDAFKAGVYASTRFDNAYLSASAAYGAYDLSTNRSIVLPGVGDHLTGDFTAHMFGARIEAGYRFPVMTSSGTTPYAAFQAQSFHLPAYGEADATGLAAFALTYNGHTFDEERSELGARFDSRLAVADNSNLLLRGRLAWAHEFSGNPTLTASFVTLPGTAFTVFGAGLPRDALLVSAGPELRLPSGWTLRAKFDGTFAGQSQTYAGTGTLRFAW